MMGFLTSPATLTVGWALLGVSGLLVVVLLLLPSQRLPLNRRRAGAVDQGSGLKKIAGVATDTVDKA